MTTIDKAERAGDMTRAIELNTVAELVEAVAPLIESLLTRITQDNAMTPQAVMVRRAADALAAVR